MRVCITLCLVTVASIAATLEVGPGKRFAKPCAAFASAANGDDIEIDASGDYARDVCNITRNNLYIRGVNGRPVIDGQGTVSGGKGLWNIQGNDIIVDNIEFKNARSVDRNGAGIRHEGRNLRVRRCYFHDNQDGILATSNAESETVVEFSEFENNGTPEGQAHNIYVNSGARLIFRFNYSHRSVGGHLLKSRARENHILYNRLLQEDGTGSYECDIPNQGKTWLVGNVIQQGPNSENPHMISFGTEVRDLIPESHLYAFQNTIVNETPNPNGVPRFFLAAPGEQHFPIVFGNNIIYGNGEFTASPSPVLLQNLITQDDPGFVNPAEFNYRLKEGSVAIDMGNGEYPGDAGDLVRPTFENLPRVCGRPRRADDLNPDFGAYEWDPQSPDPDAVCDGTQTPEAGIQMLINGSNTVIGGLSGSGRITLNRAAPPNGLSISLSSSAPSELIVPQNVQVPEGAVSATFGFTSKQTASLAVVRVSAQADGLEASTELNLSPIGVDTLRMEPAITGGGSTTALGRVTLNGAAPAGGLVVRLSSSDPSIVQVPDQVAVAQGATQATFAVRTFPVEDDTAITITASSATGDRTATLTVQAVGILSLVPAVSRFGGGSPVNLRINFNGPTPSAAASVEFESSHPSIIPVPAPLAVAGGVTFTTTSLRSQGVGSSTVVTLTSIYKNSRKSVNLTVDPSELASITSTLSTFGSGGVIRLTASLNAPLSSATPLIVNLTSDNPQLLRMPETVSISPGATSVSFEAQTSFVTVRTRVVVIGSSAGLGKVLTLTFDPIALTALSCPSSAKGGSILTCRPTINGPAPTGGAQIDLTTNAPETAGVPANTIIPPGQTTTTFQFQTRAVPFSSSISVGSAYRGSSRSVNVTITP